MSQDVIMWLSIGGLLILVVSAVGGTYYNAYQKNNKAPAESTKPASIGSAYKKTKKNYRFRKAVTNTNKK